LLDILYQIGNKADKFFKERKKYHSKNSVISVGNLTVGGSGKSQLVRYLVQKLQKEFFVLVLTKGYKRKIKKNFLSTETSANLDLCGDEPMMLNKYIQNGALAVSDNRADFLQELELQNKIPFFSNQIVLLDDGFQHYKLFRNCDILIVDDNTAKQHKTLPLGALREKPTEINRADILLYQSQSGLNFIKKYYQYRKKNIQNITDVCFKCEIIISGFEQNNTEFVIDKNDDYFLVTSIANPRRVLLSLNEFGINKIEHKIYPDHFSFKNSHVSQIISQSRERYILVTEKDFPKLEKYDNLKNKMVVIKTDFKIEKEDEFLRLIKNKI